MEELVLKKERLPRKLKKGLKKEQETPVEPAPPPPPKEKTLTEVYWEWHNEQKAHVLDALESAFGADFYEITEHEFNIEEFVADHNKATTAENAAVVARLTQMHENSGSIGRLRRKKAYTVVIHFPELTVNNGRRRQGHPIKDMWVKLELSAAFCSATSGGGYFLGNRSTFTFAECTSDYSFSHLSGGFAPIRTDVTTNRARWRDFCLGATPFSYMCTELANAWNQTQFLSFCFQLEGYLSWESLDGGPYRSIMDIQERAMSNSSSEPSIGSDACARYYKRLLALPDQIPLVMVKTPQYYGFAVKEGEEFDLLVTKVVDERRHLMVYDVTRKTRVPRVTSGKQEYINQLLRDYRGRIMTFKGRSIEFVITDQESTQKEAEDLPMIAPESLCRYIRNQLNSAFINETKSEYTTRK